MPNAGKCAGEEFAAFAGMGIISSYLLLFISFYIATYKKDGKRPTGRKAARSLKDAQLPDIAAITQGKIQPAKKANGNGAAATPGRVTRSRKA
jgi:fatty acid elongase 2/fatty acid elongase 3